MGSKLFVSSLLVLLALLVGFRVAGAANGSGAALRVDARCDPLPGPGKVQCTVRERPVEGRLRWGDVIVLSAPLFAPPLRTRVAAGDATRSDADGADFSLALAATGDGVGTLRVLARAVVCGDNGCRPVRAEATAEVAVGVQGDAGAFP
jgi:hypothetical protein